MLACMFNCIFFSFFFFFRFCSESSRGKTSRKPRETGNLRTHYLRQVQYHLVLISAVFYNMKHSRWNNKHGKQYFCLIAAVHHKDSSANMDCIKWAFRLTVNILHDLEFWSVRKFRPTTSPITGESTSNGERSHLVTCCSVSPRVTQLSDNIAFQFLFFFTRWVWRRCFVLFF